MNQLDILFAVGRIFSPFYALAMRLRTWLYRTGVFRRYKVSAPVVSIGNLTWGGTGKTPLVIQLARFAREQGLKPAVVSRGYGGSARDKVNVVSDGESLLLQADKAGDEPRFLAESLPGVPVLTGRRRIFPVKFAIENLGVDLILLDDGFQHLALERQLDIVLFQYDEPLGNGRVFPAGPLREPLSALARADCFVLTGCPSADKEPQSPWFVKELRQRFPDRPVFFSSFEIELGSNAPGHRTGPEQAIFTGERLFAFCGIGNPASFRSSLLQNGAKLGGFKVFKDHHRYCQEDAEEITAACRKGQCMQIVTTEKDYVKVRHLSWTVPLAVVKGNLVIEEGFFHFLRQRFFSLRRN